MKKTLIVLFCSFPLLFITINNVYSGTDSIMEEIAAAFSEGDTKKMHNLFSEEIVLDMNGDQRNSKMGVMMFLDRFFKNHPPKDFTYDERSQKPDSLSALYTSSANKSFRIFIIIENGKITSFFIQPERLIQ